MKYSLVIAYFALVTSTTLHGEGWMGSIECGQYEAKGIVRSINNELHIVVNEKTQSEIIITVPIQNEATLAPYVNMPVAAKVEFLNKPVKKEKLSGTVKEIKARVPNPLNPADTGIKLLSKEKCK
jgi:hypothetical protein